MNLRNVKRALLSEYLGRYDYCYDYCDVFWDFGVDFARTAREFVECNENTEK